MWKTGELKSPSQKLSTRLPNTNQPEHALYFNWLMFNWFPLVVQQSENQSSHKNAPWLWTDSSFAPTTLPLDGEVEAALWPLVCTWIIACDWGVSKPFTLEFEVMTNKYTHYRASSDVSRGMPLIPCQCTPPSLSNTYTYKTQRGMNHLNNYSLTIPRPLPPEAEMTRGQT